MAKVAMTVTLSEELRDYLKTQADAGKYPSLSAAADAAVHTLKTVERYQKENKLDHVPITAILAMMLDTVKAKISDVAPPKTPVMKILDIYRPEFWDQYLTRLDMKGHNVISDNFARAYNALTDMWDCEYVGGDQPVDSIRLNEDWRAKIPMVYDRRGLKKNLDRLLGRICLLYTSPSPRDRQKSRMPSSA